MSKYDRFNRDKYVKTFDQLFGQGTYEQGLGQARELGQKKAEATLARKSYQKQEADRKKAEAKAIKEAEKQAAIEASLGPATKPSSKSKSSKDNNILDKLVGGVKSVGKEIARFDDRIGNALTFGLTGEIDKRLEKQYESKGKKVDFTSYQDKREDGNIAGKGVDLVSDLIGYGIGGVGAVSALRGAGLTGKGVKALSAANKAGRATGKQIAKGAASAAGEGALVGGGLTALESAVRLGVNKESDSTLTDELKRIGIGTALGGALDPLATIAGPLLKNASRSAVDNAVGRQTGQSFQEAITNPATFRANPPTPQTNRDGLQSVGRELTASDSLQNIGRSADTASPLNEFSRPVQTPEVVDLIDPTIYKPKKTVGKAAEKLQQSFTNDTAALRDIDRQIQSLDADGLINYLNPKTTIKSRLKDVASDSSLEKSAINAKGARTVAAKAATERFEPFLKNINASTNVQLKDLGEYAVAKRTLKLLEDSADTRAARDSLVSEIDALKRTAGSDAVEVKALEERLEDYVQYTTARNVTPEQLQARILQSEQNPELVKFYDDFVNLQQQNLKDLYDGELISKQLYDTLSADKSYVSLRRNFEDGANATGSANRRPQNPLERLKGGSDAAVKDPVSESIRNAYNTRFNIEKNKSLKVVEKFAKIDKGEELFRGVPQPNANTISVFNKGVQKHYEVPQALKNYVDNFSSYNDPDVLTNVVQKTAQLQRKLTTQYSLAFQLKSLVREPIQAIAVSRTSKNALDGAKNISLGFVDAFFGPQLQELTKGLPKALQFNSYKANFDKLGGTGYQLIRTTDDDLQRVAKELLESNTAKGKIKRINPFNILGNFGERVEAGPRLGEFRAAKNQGYSDADALYEAADLTNYKRSGTAVQGANKYVPFLNATIQGNARVARAFQEAPERTIARGVAALTSTSALVYGMRYLDTVSDEQRQELQNLNQFEKDSYLHIPSPIEGDDTIFALPKAFAIGQIFMNPMERALDDYYNNVIKEETVPDHVREGFKSVLKSFAPPYEVAGITTAYELKQNKSLFTGQEIESSFDRSAGTPKQDIEAYNQAYLTKVLADALNALTFSSDGEGAVSPAQVDYVIKDLTGSVGTRALGLSDQFLSDNAPVKTTSDQLLNPLQQFVQDPTRRSGNYEELQKLAKVEKRSNVDLTGLTEDEKNVERSTRTAQNYEKAFKDLNKAIQAVRANKELSSQEKKDAIIELRREQDSLGSRAINRYNSSR